MTRTLSHLFACIGLLTASASTQEPAESAPAAPVTEVVAPEAETAPPSPAAPEPAVEPAPVTQPPASIAIEIDLTAQKAWVLQDGNRVYESSISSGRTGHETPPGNFTVTQKSADHKSSLYGKIVDNRGRVLVSDADSDMAIPAGGKFVSAPMKNFLRINGAVGMHAGRIPGYPASHGCIRLPPSKAKLFFDIAQLGTPVRVFGKAPRTATPKKRPRNAIANAAAPTPAPKKSGGGWFSWLKRPAPSAKPAPAR